MPNPDCADAPTEIPRQLGEHAGRKLFVPQHFDFSDHESLLRFIAERPLAHFITFHGGSLRVTAAPIVHNRVLDDESDCQHEFVAHIAKRNPQTAAIQSGADAVALLQGPDAYISPRWRVANPGLPTWSYVSVQLRGVLEAVETLDESRAILIRTITHMERDAAKPWTLSEANPETVETLIRHIVAFRFKVRDMQGVRRLNQNTAPADRRGIIEGLSSLDDAGAHQIAELMHADSEDCFARRRAR